MKTFLAQRVARWGWMLVVCGMMGVAGPAAAADDDDLAALIKSLNERVAPPDDKRQELLKLAAAIQARYCPGQSKEVADCRLANVLNALKEYVGAVEKDSNAAKLRQDAIDKLVSIAESDATAGAVLLAELLAARLSDKDEKKKPDRNAKPLSDALAKIAAVKDEPQSKDSTIYVVGAYYGDINAIDFALKRFDGPNPTLDNAGLETVRFCSATSAVRVMCQGQPSCNLGSAPAAGAFPTASFSGATLCGYEPAPFADARHKALVIGYQCVAGKWDPNARTFPTDTMTDVPTGPKPAPKPVQPAQQQPPQSQPAQPQPPKPQQAQPQPTQPPGQAQPVDDKPALKATVVRWLLVRNGEVARVTCNPAKAEAPKTTAQTTPQKSQE